MAHILEPSRLRQHWCFVEPPTQKPNVPRLGPLACATDIVSRFGRLLSTHARLQEELMMSLKKSVRGSIRQAPNVISWVQVLLNLRTWGCSDSSPCNYIWVPKSSLTENAWIYFLQIFCQV